MQNTKAKIVTALLLAALSLTIIPMAFAVSGNILINTATPPSASNQSYSAGSNINLYMGATALVAAQFNLYISPNGFATIVTPPDQLYSATFDTANLTNPTFLSNYTAVVSGSTLKWTIGNNWINGSLPSLIAGGNYYIKAYDGNPSDTAVTDTFIVISSSLSVSPTSGNPGRSVTITGKAFSAGATVNLNYTYGTVNTLFATVTADATYGNFTYVLANAPDTLGNLAASSSTTGTLTSLAATTITFWANQTVSGTALSATWTENPRGLKAFGASSGPLVSSTGNLFGNGTDFTTVGPVQVGVGQNVNVTGNNFYPGAATIMFDSATVATPTVGSTGTFTTLVTVPVTGIGTHNITVTDANNGKIIVTLTVIPSLVVSPVSGPVGTAITVTAYGFPASGTPTGTVYNVTVSWTGYSGTIALTSGLTNSIGQVTVTFNAPHDFGGAHTITARANDSVETPTTGTGTFTITPLLVVNPSTFSNDGTILVNATGTGFNPSVQFSAAVDNAFVATDYPIANGTGDIQFGFVNAGFQAGLHVFSLYPTGGGTPLAPTAWAIFNVTDSSSTASMLTAINQTLTQHTATLAAINGTVVTILTNQGLQTTTLNAINASVVAISGNIATLSTNLGTLTTTLNAIGANVTSIKGTVATLQTTLGAVQTTVNAINANITSINNGFATVQTSIGTLTTSVSSISATLSSVSGTVGTISTTVGSISSSLSSIGTTVTSISSGVATVQTDVGTIKGTVTSINNGVATIQTSIGTLQTSVDGVKTDVAGVKSDVAGVKTDVDGVPGQVNVPIWIAVVLALIAALAAIASLLLVRRKIAG